MTRTTDLKLGEITEIEHLARRMVQQGHDDVISFDGMLRVSADHHSLGINVHLDGSPSVIQYLSIAHTEMLYALLGAILREQRQGDA